MSIRPPIADDEPLARQGIRGFLRHHSDIEVTQECFDEESAAAAILEQQPDLVFLHVQMPELGDQGVGGSKVQILSPRANSKGLIGTHSGGVVNRHLL